MSRSGAVAALVALVCGLASATAFAGLPSGLPGLTTPTQVAGITIPGVTVPGVTLPGVTTPVVTTPTVTTPTVTTPTVTTPQSPGDVVTVVTGAAGDVISSLGSAPGSSGSTVPAKTVDSLITTLLGGSGAASGATGGGSSSSSSAAGGGTFNASSSADHKAPKLTFTVLSKLRTAAKTGKLRLRVRSSEASVVAFTSMLRAGKARRVGGKALKVSHKLAHLKAVVLAFHKAGALKVDVKVPRKWRASLAHAKTAHLAIQAWAADLARNQARKGLKRTVRH